MKSEVKLKYSSQWLKASKKSILCNIRYGINQFLHWDEQIGTKLPLSSLSTWCRILVWASFDTQDRIKLRSFALWLNRPRFQDVTHQQISITDESGAQQKKKGASICCSNLEAVQNKGVGWGEERDLAHCRHVLLNQLERRARTLSLVYLNSTTLQICNSCN